MYYLNIDFFYYLIYVFFRSIWNGLKSLFIFEPNKGSSDINLLDLINYFTNSNYSIAGNGLNSSYDSYSLFTPPHGWSSWGNSFGEAISNWFYIFSHNPYCPNCYSFFDLIFGGINSFFWALILLIFVWKIYLKDKENELKKLDKKIYETIEEDDGLKNDKKNNSLNEKEIKNKVEREGKNENALKWELINILIQSNKEEDWKKAILLADEILADGLKNIKTVNLWMKLKKSNLKNKNIALESHQVAMFIRTKENFKINYFEADKIIKKYQIIFNEIYHM